MPTSPSSSGLSVFAFAGLSVLVHVGISFALPGSVSLAAEAAPPPAPSFFELMPLVIPVAEPAPEPEPEPVPETAPVAEREVVRVARAAPPSDEPVSEDPAATPDASSVVPDTEAPRQEASVVSTEGGLATNLRAGSGGGGAARGTRHEGPVGAAPGGTGAEAVAARREDLSALLRPYLRLVRSELLQHLRTPRDLSRDDEPRVVKLGVTIDRDGRIITVRLRESCGTVHLDELALASVRAVPRVSAPPEALPWASPRELTFPIAYR